MKTRETAAAVAIALLATVLFTWPLARHPLSTLAAPTGPGDPFLNCWILGWDLGTITSDPAALVTGRIFDANIFHPASRTLAYSDHLIVQALALAPVYILSGNVALCYNLLLFGSVAASMLAMYAFARSVTGSRAGAALAGLAWGVMPFRIAHLLHLQLHSLYWLPLAFLFLHRVMAGRRRRDAVLLGVFAALQAISSVYWGVIGALALGVAAAALAVGIGRWRSSVIARRLALAAVVGAVLVAPFAWPYWQVQQREGFARNLYEASQHEATAASYVRVPPGNLLYGRTGLLRPGARQEGPVGTQKHEGPEQELFPGLVVGALALVGAWAGWRRDSRPAVLAMAAVLLTGFVLSLGPGGLRGLYAFMHRVVFGFQAIRAPARFGVLVVFGGAVLAALGVRAIEAWLRRSGRARAAAVVPIVLAGFAALEYLSVPLPTVPAPPVTSAVGKWLAHEPAAGAVLYLPLDNDLGNTPAMVQSLEHRRPIVNGYSGQRPAFFMGLVDTLNQVPAAEALWTLRDLNVRFVVSPRALSLTEGGPLVERAKLGGDTVYELRWTASSEAAVPRPEPPAPPEPGALPFATGETLVYRVSWRNAASMGMSAGTATFTAGRSPVPGAPDGGSSMRHLAVELQTAAWVARFFEARDRIETWADERLVPIRQEQHLREGRRVVDRETRFDPVSRTLTVGEGPALPWPREARDAISAFFYVRTLPLAPGYTAAFPLVEGGRRYTVEVSVDGVERIKVGDRQVETFRTTPRISSTGNQGRTVQSTVWIATDSRRIPLVLEIETAFGSFRAELERESSR